MCVSLMHSASFSHFNSHMVSKLKTQKQLTITM